MRILITGVTGFVGSHMAEFLMHLSEADADAARVGDQLHLYGTKRRLSNTENLSVPVNLLDCELTDYTSVAHVIKEAKPELIFHLAAQSFVPYSWSAPAETIRVNLLGSLNLFEAVREYTPETKIHIAGSSEEYGFVTPTECPITEDHPLRPLSPYGVSKAAMDLLAQQYVRSFKLKIIITRAFNHTGPRRGIEMATSSFASQIAMIEAGMIAPVISHGNLEARRDFTDVRDMVRAYWLAVNNCGAGEPYNICSGVTYTIGSVLDKLLSFSEAKPELREDPARMRPSDVPLLLGSAAKFKKLTGWEPKYAFSQTLLDLLNYWRTKLSRSSAFKGWHGTSRPMSPEDRRILDRQIEEVKHKK